MTGANVDKAHTIAVAGKGPSAAPGMARIAAADTQHGVTITSADQLAQLKYFDYNLHALKKGVSSALLDVALLMANASQLKSVIMNGPDSDFYIPMMVDGIVRSQAQIRPVQVMLITSILLQVVIGVMLIWLGRININKADGNEQEVADWLNNIVIIGIFLLTILNIFISALGISVSPKNA